MTLKVTTKKGQRKRKGPIQNPNQLCKIISNFSQLISFFAMNLFLWEIIQCLPVYFSLQDFRLIILGFSSIMPTCLHFSNNQVLTLDVCSTTASSTSSFTWAKKLFSRLGKCLRAERKYWRKHRYYAIVKLYSYNLQVFHFVIQAILTVKKFPFIMKWKKIFNSAQLFSPRLENWFVRPLLVF